MRQALHQDLFDNGPRKNMATKCVARKTNKPGLHGVPSLLSVRKMKGSDLQEVGRLPL